MSTTTTAAPFQFGLFEQRPPAQRQSATSVAAAQDIQEDAGTLRGFVLAYLRGSGLEGATDEEMQTALNMNPSTQRPRRIELVEKGLVVSSGFTRPTRSGRAATVWQAA